MVISLNFHDITWFFWTKTLDRNRKHWTKWLPNDSLLHWFWTGMTRNKMDSKNPLISPIHTLLGKYVWCLMILMPFWDNATHFRSILVENPCVWVHVPFLLFRILIIITRKKYFTSSDPHRDIFVIVSDISSRSIYGIYCLTFFSGIHSTLTVCSGIISCIYSDIPPGILSILSDILPNIYSEIISGIYSGILYLTFY